MAAFSATQGAAQFVKQGAMGVADMYTTKRKYSLSDLIVMQERSYAKLDNILRMEMKTVQVSDPEPKVLTMQETPVKFDIATASASSSGSLSDIIGITDAQALFLQAGDVLQCPDLFCDATGANYSTTKYASGYAPETMIVQQVTLSGLASGTASVRVLRGNGNSPASPTQLATTYKLIHMGNALADGGNAPNPISHEPTDVQNYCQFFSKTWGVTDSEKPLDVYGKLSPAQRAAMKRTDFFRQKEWAYFFGRKSKITQSQGSTLWMTGGIVEFVPGASTALDGVSRLIDFGGAFSLDLLREKTEIIYRYGNAQQIKHWFVGGKFFSVLYNALEKFITVNDEYSQRYGWTVMQLELGHGIALLHRHPLLTDQATSLNEYSMDAIIVDMEYMKLMNYIDVTVKTNVQNPGAHTEVNEIYCQNGLWRTFPDAHAVIFGITG